MNLPCLTQEQNERLEQLLDWGIYIDGSHHKQWCLYQIAELLGYELYEDTDPGIAP